MKNLSFLLLTFSLIMSNDLFGFNNDSTQLIKNAYSKSYNINGSLILGNELGLSVRFEIEDNDLGKLIFNSQAGFYFNSSENLMLDLGLGYGYPILHSKSNFIFLNGILTFMQQGRLGGIPNNSNGPSGLIELEFRKTFNEFSICLTPFYRGFFPSNDILNTFGLRIGVAYNFHK